MPCSEAIEFFKISRDSAYKWMKKYAETGNVSDVERKEYPAKKIEEQALIDELAFRADATLEELAEKFLCSHVAVWKRLKALGITRKKNDTIVNPLYKHTNK